MSDNRILSYGIEEASQDKSETILFDLNESVIGLWGYQTSGNIESLGWLVYNEAKCFEFNEQASERDIETLIAVCTTLGAIFVLVMMFATSNYLIREKYVTFDCCKKKQ